MNGPANTRRGQTADFEQGSSPNRRSHERVPLAAAVLISAQGLQVDGTTTDVGFGGCFVNASNLFAEGQLVDVTLRHQDKILRGQAIVVRNEKDEGVALEFTAIPANQEHSLLEWLSEFHRDMYEQRHPVA